MINKKGLFPIGIGAWGHGGFSEINPDNDDEKQINAISHQLLKGMNFVELNFWNSRGKSVKLIKEAIDKSGIDRDKLFLMQSIYNYYNPKIEDVEHEFESCLKLFKVKYIDALQFPLTAIKVYGFENLINLTKKYLDKGLIRHVSVTNFNLEYLKKYHDIFGDKLFSHELHFSFEIRDLEDLQITKYADDHGIINVPYQPLRRNRTSNLNWPVLVEMAKRYNKTQNQIILRWIIQKGFHPLVKSENIQHIDENLDSMNFVLSDADYKIIDEFRVPNYKSKPIDWWMENGDSKLTSCVHGLPNIFDEEYKNISKL